jgi:hypothetical protein
MGEDFYENDKTEDKSSSIDNVTNQDTGMGDGKIKKKNALINDIRGVAEGTKSKKRSVDGKQGNRMGGQTRKYVFVAVAVAVAVLLLCSYIYSLINNRIMSVVAMVGDVTILDKYREGEDNFVNFRAGSYNLIPSKLNEDGITIRIEKELYDAIALDVKYGLANIVFQVPYSVAKKAGYVESQGNVQVLWTEDIVNKYAWIRAIVWSVN